MLVLLFVLFFYFISGPRFQIRFLFSFSIKNLATVFGPNLIRQKNESALESVENTMLVSQVVDDLIRMYPQVFEVFLIFNIYFYLSSFLIDNFYLCNISFMEKKPKL